MRVLYVSIYKEDIYIICIPGQTHETQVTFFSSLFQSMLGNFLSRFTEHKTAWSCYLEFHLTAHDITKLLHLCRHKLTEHKTLVCD
jgi:hypothetical protein